MDIRFTFECGDAFGLLLEGSPFVSELPNLVQEDPDLASESFREIVDISAFDGSITKRGRLMSEGLALAVHHSHCRDPSQLCLTSSRAWSN